MTKSISDKDKKILCTKSGNRCALPNCRKELVVSGNESDSHVLLGEIAHINGDRENSARYDSNMNDIQRNSYDNLIFVCNSCHKIIDDQPNTYTVQRLKEIKNAHERWVIESTKNEMSDVSFVELKNITGFLLFNKVEYATEYTLIPPKDKIRKNRLSAEVEKLIAMGMTQASLVKSFIDKSPDIEFGERLKNGFVRKYEELHNVQKMHGDDLFYALIDFASNGSNDFKVKAAGLSVLVYLFEKCEVFEK